jgi:hypothetical protein
MKYELLNTGIHEKIKSLKLAAQPPNSQILSSIIIFFILPTIIYVLQCKNASTGSSALKPCRKLPLAPIKINNSGRQRFKTARAKY